MNDFLPGISNALAEFSFKTTLDFFIKSQKNSLFSPYSLFLALFLSSALNPDISPRILKHLNFPNTKISPGDQIKQLRYFSKSVETVPSLPKNINSSSFNRFISKYDLNEDQKFISYIILNRIINGISNNDSTDKEAKISSFLDKVKEDPDETSLSQKAQNFKKIIKEDIHKYPLIIGSNHLFLNNNAEFSIPAPITKKYRNYIVRTEFPEPGYKVINKFVENSTRGLIHDFISASDLPSSSPYFIANTIYFKGTWKHQFKVLQKEHIFNTINGNEEKMEFLKGTDDFKYYEDDDLLYIKLQYYKCSFSYEIIMPQKIKRFNSVKTQLFDSNLLDKISKEATYTNILLKMPKFTIKTDLMNFDHIVNIQGADSIIQKAVIIVDEKGTKAAAATGVIARGINLPKTPKKVIINQPFIFMIRDTERNIPLFIGEFVNPPKE